MTALVSHRTGWLALTIGVVTVAGIVFLPLFFTIGQPWGSLHDASIALSAILSALLAGLLYTFSRRQFRRMGLLGLITAATGAALVLTGSILVMSGAVDKVLAGHYMSFGYALIGLWLLTFNLAGNATGSLPNRLVQLGLIAGAMMELGLSSIFGMIFAVDANDPAPWYVTIGTLGTLGRALLYPAWSIWLGNLILRDKLAA